MQYFKHELFASHAFVETRRDGAHAAGGYRRTLRYGHARLGRQVDQPTGADVAAALPGRLIALPRVQAVVDAIAPSAGAGCRAA